MAQNPVLKVAITILIVFGFPFALLEIGQEAGKRKMRKEAIEAGVARWIIDHKTGDKSFEYLKIHGDGSE